MERRVLIADPNLSRFTQTRATLEAEGYSTLGLHDWRSIPSKHKHWPPDAVVVAPEFRAHVGTIKQLLIHTPTITHSEHSADWLSQLNEQLAVPPKRLTFGDRIVDLTGLLVRGPEGDTTLTTIEAALMAYLAMHPETAIHRNQLLQRVWGYNANVTSRAADSTIKRLRKKIERDPKNPRYLLTVFGVGYRMVGYQIGVQEAKTHPLPTAFTAQSRCLGRKTEWEALDSAVKRGDSVITLLGFGGVGKTTLARAWVKQQTFPTSFFLDLSHATSEAHILQTFAHTLNLPKDTPVEDTLSVCRAILCAHQTGIIILDNCEQVRLSVRRVLEALQEGTSFLWLITSREPIGLRNEQVISVRSMDTPAATELFHRRVEQMGLSAIADKDGPLVESLVTALGGIPLAIELAAGQLGIMRISDILAKLEHNRGLWSDSNRTERHQTMDATLRWSWDLLSKAEQLTLAQLAIFPASFELALAEQTLIHPEDGELSQIIRALHQKSLVHRHNDGRIHLLEVTRGFALNELSALGLLDQTFERHAAATAKLYGDFRQRGPFFDWQPIQPYALEFANLRQAFQYSANPSDSFSIYRTLDWIYSRMGPVTERRQIFEALPPEEALHPEQRPWYWLCSIENARILNPRGDYHDRFERAYTCALEVGNAALTRQIIVYSLEMQRMAGQAAPEWLERLSDYSDNTAHHAGILTYFKGIAASIEGNHTAANAAYRLSATKLRPEESPYYAAVSWYRLGFRAFESNRLDEAERNFFRCISILEKFAPDATKSVESLFGLTAMAANDYETAVEVMQNSLERSKKERQIHHITEDHFVLGLAHQLAGELNEAKFHYAQSLRIAELLHRTDAHLVTRALLATTEAALGAKYEAKKWMALATDRTNMPDPELRLIDTCDLIVQLLNHPSAARLARARTHIEALETIRLTDRRLDWTLQLLSRAIDASA